MIRKIRTLTCLLMVCGIMFLGFNKNVQAAEGETVYEPFIVVSSYEVSDGIITPGKSFELTIEVENTDTKVATKGSIMTISFPDGISTAYGSSNQIYLESLKAGEKRQVTFNLSASSYYSRASAPFVINIISEIRTNSATIYVPVHLDNSAFKVVSQAIPETAGAGDKIAASLSFKSLLGEKLSNVVLSVYIDNDSTPVTTANIGNISAGASKSQNVTFFINEKGMHSVKMELTYNLPEGDSASAELYSGKIQISDPSVENNLPVESIQEENIQGQDIIIIGGCLGLSVLLGIGIVLIAKKYN